MKGVALSGQMPETPGKSMQEIQKHAIPTSARPAIYAAPESFASSLGCLKAADQWIEDLSAEADHRKMKCSGLIGTDSEQAG